MRIVATGSYCREVSGELPPLKTLTREATGASVRRIGRFVQLALIGASNSRIALAQSSCCEYMRPSSTLTALLSG